MWLIYFFYFQRQIISLITIFLFSLDTRFELKLYIRHLTHNMSVKDKVNIKISYVDPTQSVCRR